MKSDHRQDERGYWKHFIQCDKCGAERTGWLGYASAVASALANGWKTVEEETFCPKCLNQTKTYLFDFVCRGLIEAESTEKAEKVLEKLIITSEVADHDIYVDEVCDISVQELGPPIGTEELNLSEYLGLSPCSPSASTSESVGRKEEGLLSQEEEA